MQNGFNTFRIPFLMERLSPPATGLTGPFNSAYLSGLQTVSISGVRCAKGLRTDLAGP